MKETTAMAGSVRLTMEWEGNGILKLHIQGRHHLELVGIPGSWEHWNFMERSELHKLETSLAPGQPIRIPVAHALSRILAHCGIRKASEREHYFAQFLPVIQEYEVWYRAQIAKGKAHRKAPA